MDKEVSDNESTAQDAPTRCSSTIENLFLEHRQERKQPRLEDLLDSLDEELEEDELPVMPLLTLKRRKAVRGGLFVRRAVLG